MELEMKTLIQAETEYYNAAAAVLKEKNFILKAGKVDVLLQKQSAAFQVLFEQVREIKQFLERRK